MPELPPDFIPSDQTYSIYGKNVRSNYPLPLPGANGSPADITIVYEGIVPKTENCAPTPDGRVWRKEMDHYLLRFYNTYGFMNQFLFRFDGSHIRASQSWPAWRDTRFALMNPVLAAAASLRGDDVLHASSLVHKGQSSLVMGISGAGKSTLSAALAVCGMTLHSDDVALLASDGNGASFVMAGYPMLKIDSALAKTLGLQNESLAQIFTEPADIAKSTKIPLENLPQPETEKWLSAGHLPGGFHSGPALLNSIIILDVRLAGIAIPRITRLNAATAVVALTEHMYGRDWLNLPGQKSLSLCTRLAKSVPVYRVNMPDGLHRLLNSAEIIYNQIIKI